MEPKLKQRKSVDEAIEQHSHKHDDAIMCTGKNCLGKEHVMKRDADKGMIVCENGDCDEVYLRTKKNYENQKFCPDCKVWFASRKTFDNCPYCDKEV